MSNFIFPRVTDEEIPSSSSDEKMDTGSDSYRSQDTPNSVLSSDFDDNQDQNVLRIQNPESDVSNGHDSENNHNLKTAASKLKEEWNDSLISKMSCLTLDSPRENRPKNLGISPPRFSSTLISTTNHPLMCLGSPEENFPDVVPKKLPKIEDDKDLSLSSVEEDRHTESNGYFYNPQRNTSKNNLYFTENFVTAESFLLQDSSLDNASKSVSRTSERRKIVPDYEDANKTPQKNGALSEVRENTVKDFIDRNKVTSQSTPKASSNISIPEPDVQHSGVADWCESPSHLRMIPNFELPIEMSSAVGLNNDLNSPDVVSSSTQEDRSSYQALLDPYTGSVALHHKPAKSPGSARRKIRVPLEEDRCSLDSVSGCSMESEEEPPQPDPGCDLQIPSDEEDTKGTQSTNTCSECSDLIPEYSAAEESHNERSWVSVPRAKTLCDMKVIEPFKRVLSHGGYDRNGAAVLVFSACHLPDGARPDYRYVMDNLFLYVIWSLERLVTDEYVLVYLHGSAGPRRLPTFHWLHECYKLIDRRLRKSLKHLYLVHPTFWLKSFVVITKPFVSSKFFRKLSYVRNLDELARLVPVEPNAIPESVKQFDANKR